MVKDELLIKLGQALNSAETESDRTILNSMLIYYRKNSDLTPLQQMFIRKIHSKVKKKKGRKVG
jgi:hypothetical protein